MKIGHRSTSDNENPATLPFTADVDVSGRCEINLSNVHTDRSRSTEMASRHSPGPISIWLFRSGAWWCGPAGVDDHDVRRLCRDYVHQLRLVRRQPANEINFFTTTTTTTRKENTTLYNSPFFPQHFSRASMPTYIQDTLHCR